MAARVRTHGGPASIVAHLWAADAVTDTRSRVGIPHTFHISTRWATCVQLRSGWLAIFCRRWLTTAVRRRCCGSPSEARWRSRACLLLWLAPSAGGPHRLMAVGRVREFCLTSMCCHLDGCVASRRGSLAAAALGLVEGALSGEAAFAWASCTRGRERVLAAGRGGLVTRTCDIDHGPCRAAGGLACTRAFASSLAALAAPACVRDWREPLRRSRLAGRLWPPPLSALSPP